jgi:hypothetical protein
MTRKKLPTDRAARIRGQLAQLQHDCDQLLSMATVLIDELGLLKEKLDLMVKDLLDE